MNLFKFDPLTKRRMTFKVWDTGIEIPATVVCGKEEGRFATISAGVHCREYIGIQAVQEVTREIDPKNVDGTILFLNCINFEGFIVRSPDVMPQDGKNLNRVFPGNPDGTSTDRLALWLEEEVVRFTDWLVDLHSGGYSEALTPHTYFHGTAAPEVCEVSEKLATLMNVQYRVKSSAQNGFYSWSGQCGVPAIILERGGYGLTISDEIRADKADILNVLRGMGSLDDGVPAICPTQTRIDVGFYLDAPTSGCWYPRQNPGDFINEGDVIGEFKDIYGDPIMKIEAQATGVILYQTVTLGLEKGTPMIAYGRLSGTAMPDEFSCSMEEPDLPVRFIDVSQEFQWHR